MRRAVVAMFALGLLGCQAPTAGTGRSELAATPVAVQAVEPLAATALTSVWGEVPKQCLCHGEPLARVAAALQDAQLSVDFKLEHPTEGWQLFSVTFDPARVQPDQVTRVMQNAGAMVIPAPVPG